ncbi:hypothetical protein JCM10021v2_005056 [Rhodotorula toruloides]
MDHLRRPVDSLLEAYHLVEKRQVGWMAKNRKTGEMMREQQPLMKKIQLLLFFNPVTEWIDFTHVAKMWLHRKTIQQKPKEESQKSKQQIASFVSFYHINMEDFEPSDINAYPTFQDFFIRKHKPGTRPITAPDDPTIAVISADSRVVTYPTVTLTIQLWIKGNDFSIAQLIDDPVKAKTWEDGAIASYRLSPQDYHRYHCPVAGTVSWWKELDGDYYEVDALALQSRVPILSANARSAVCIDSPEFGQVLFVAIGAIDVGTVKLNPKATTPGSTFEKGEEIGIFEFGGSSIIVAFEKHRIQFDDDLLDESYKQIMVDVEVGQRLGVATKPASK